MSKGKPNSNWKQLVQDYRRSGKTARAWCIDNQIHYNTLAGWKKRINKAESTNFCSSLSSSFVELQNPSSTDSGLFLEFNGIKIHLNSKFDETVLRRCLDCLKGK